MDLGGGGLGQKQGRKNTMATRSGKKNSTQQPRRKKTHQPVDQEKKTQHEFSAQAPLPRSLMVSPLCSSFYFIFISGYCPIRNSCNTAGFGTCLLSPLGLFIPT